MTTPTTEKLQALVNPLKFDFNCKNDGKNIKVVRPQRSTEDTTFGSRLVISRRGKSLTEIQELKKFNVTNGKRLPSDNIANGLEKRACYMALDEFGLLDQERRKKKKVDSIMEKKVEESKNISAYFFSRETEKECRCKHCKYVAMTKSDYWEHLKIHIEENLRWDCPLCKFTTKHKYHLMHHFREHVGSVPTKSVEFVKRFLDKSELPSKIKSSTEQLKLRNARKRQDSHRLEKFIILRNHLDVVNSKMW